MTVISLIGFIPRNWRPVCRPESANLPLLHLSICTARGVRDIRQGMKQQICSKHPTVNFEEVEFFIIELQYPVVFC